MDKYIETNKLTKIVARMSKADSSYFYFTLESNEGIAFYSTLTDSLRKEYRDVLVHSPIEMTQALDQIIETSKKMYPIEILSRETVIDSPDYEFKL